MGLQIRQIHEFDGRTVRGAEFDLRGHAVLEGLLPAGGTQAPAIARLEAGEVVFRHGGGEVIADGLGIFEKFFRDLHADHMHALVERSGAAIPIAVKPRHGTGAAGLKFSAKDVGGHGRH